MIKSAKGIVRYAIRSCPVVLIIFALSCENRQVPEGVLTHDQMVTVMSELYIAEQKISSLGIKRDSLEQIAEVVQDKVFAKVGISDSVFRMSMNYYMDHPQELELIYTSLVDSLNLREQRIPAMQPR